MDVIAMKMGYVGFLVASNAATRIKKLEEKLKEAGVLDQQYEAE